MGDWKPIGGIGDGPSKAPSNNQCPVIVFLDNAQLSIVATDAPNSIAYYIYDANGTEVLSGTPAFTQGTATISLSSLPAGTYCLRLTVNDHNYYGELDI